MSNAFDATARPTRLCVACGWQTYDLADAGPCFRCGRRTTPFPTEGAAWRAYARCKEARAIVHRTIAALRTASAPADLIRAVDVLRVFCPCDDLRAGPVGTDDS